MSVRPNIEGDVRAGGGEEWISKLQYEGRISTRGYVEDIIETNLLPGFSLVRGG